MGSKKIEQFLKIPTKVMYLIADQRADLSDFYAKFNVEIVGQEMDSLQYERIKISQKQFVDLYIFPRNREIRSYCELYVEILPKADLIFYFLSSDSSINQSIEWLNIFQKENTLKIAFCSSIRTYLERQQTLTRVNSFFIKDASYSVYFPKINPDSFHDCIFNLEKAGIQMMFYLKTIPTFSRFKWLCKKIKEKLKKSQQISGI